MHMDATVLAGVDVTLRAFEPLANRLTVLELDVAGATLRGAGAAIAAHLSGSLKRLKLRMGA